MEHPDFRWRHHRKEVVVYRMLVDQEGIYAEEEPVAFRQFFDIEEL